MEFHRARKDPKEQSFFQIVIPLKKIFHHQTVRLNSELSRCVFDGL